MLLIAGREPYPFEAHPAGFKPDIIQQPYRTFVLMVSLVSVLPVRLFARFFENCSALKHTANSEMSVNGSKVFRQLA